MWFLLACKPGLVAAGVDTDETDTTVAVDTDDSAACDAVVWYRDADGDGYGGATDSEPLCDPPHEDWVRYGGDCKDDDAEIHPGSSQQQDGLDSDCDGRRDWRVTFHVTADDAFDACLDQDTNLLGSGGNWTIAYVYERWLPSGTHTFGIKGWDTGMVITAAAADIRSAAGGPWVTDASWKFDPNPSLGAGTRTGWCSTGFDDSGWQSANVIGPVFTTSPWTGAPSGFPTDSQAWWVWDYYPVNLNTQYLRKEFTLP